MDPTKTASVLGPKIWLFERSTMKEFSNQKGRLYLASFWDVIRPVRVCSWGWLSSLAEGRYWGMFKLELSSSAVLWSKLKCCTLGNNLISKDVGLCLCLINSLTVAQEMTNLHTRSLIKERVNIIDQSPGILALLSLGGTIIYTITRWNVITLPHCVTTRKLALLKLKHMLLSADQ